MIHNAHEKKCGRFSEAQILPRETIDVCACMRRETGTHTEIMTERQRQKQNQN